MFLYMDIYRCGKIARVSVNSFVRQYPQMELHLFGVADDFAWLQDMSSKGKLVFENISSDKKLLRRWDVHGHWGTAHLWSRLIQSRPEKYLIHLDSDIIFRGRSLDPIFDKMDKGYDLIGSPRNYKNNLNRRDDVRHLSDLVQTALFAFNRELISEHPFEELVDMVRGYFNPLGHAVIDFFDPVMFEILKNGGKIFYLDIDDYGGTHRDGHRKNVMSELNLAADFGRLLCHYSSVGSGMKYYHDPLSRIFTPKSYTGHALKRYWSFCKIFYDQDLPIPHDKKYDADLKYKEEIALGVDLHAVRTGADWILLEKKYHPTFSQNIKTAINILSEFIRKVVRKSAERL